MSCSFAVAQAAVLISHGHAASEVAVAELAVHAASLQLTLQPAAVHTRFSGTISAALCSPAHGCWEEAVAPYPVQLDWALRRSRWPSLL